MSGSGMLRRKQAERNFWFDIAEKMTRQIMLDTVLITLHEEFGFGAKRLYRLQRRWGAIHDRFYGAFDPRRKQNPECDKLRDELDTLLRKLTPKDEPFYGFNERYEYIKKVTYDK